MDRGGRFRRIGAGAALVFMVSACATRGDGGAAAAGPAPGAEDWHVLAYTRTPLAPNTYSRNLAASMHLALAAPGGRFEPLNENYGILFARAVPTDRLDVNDVRTLADPYIFVEADGTFGVVATRTLPDGTPDDSARSSLLYFTSRDLRLYTEVGLVDLGRTDGVVQPRVRYDAGAGHYVVSWTSSSGADFHATFGDLGEPSSRGPVRTGAAVAAPPLPAVDIPGAVPSGVVGVSAEVARALQVRFGRIRNVAVDVADIVVAGGEPLRLDGVRARLTYSDGSVAGRHVDWDAADVAAVDVRRPGRYTVRGTVRQVDYPFPFIAARADPTIARFRGRYYFIATDDTNGGHVGAQNMFIRTAETIQGLRDAPEHTILTTGPANIRGCFWAPELHEFNGTLHVFFAPCIGEASWQRVQAHVLRLRPGGDPVRAADWEAPRPVLQRDGSPLQLDAQHPGISLDMTYFEVRDRAYVAWSQRYIVDGVIGDAENWIATVDPGDPFRLSSDPVRLTTAEYGWDHNHAAVAEGAFVVQRDGVVYMTYSGSAVGPTYVTGLVFARDDADLLDPQSWTKLNYPVLKTDVEIGQWGPGHNSFTHDEDGNLLVVYHAKDTPTTRERHTGIRRVHWASDGMPILDMKPDEEVAPGLRRVSVQVTVRPPG